MQSKQPVRILLIGLGLVVALGLVFAHETSLFAATTVSGQIPLRANGLFAQVVITPTKDNTLYESSGAQFSNGKGENLFVGNTAMNSARRALLAFDIAGQLPADATIISATLQLQMSKTAAGAQSLSLHRVQSDWGEGTSDAGGNEGGGTTPTTGDATWVHQFFDTQLWQTPGGDFVVTGTATTTVNNIGVYIWRSPQMVADLQSWLNAPTTNFGWILLGNEAQTTSTKRFGARENSTPANRPQLTIVYQSAQSGLHFVYLPLAQK